MPRDAAGNYNLVAGNPVASGEVIASTWANNTMNDVALALSDSLSRDGQGGMRAPFLFFDGRVTAPGAAWINEPSTGFYRFDGGDLRVGVLAQDVMRWRQSGTEVWDEPQQEWVTLEELAGRSGLTVVEVTGDITALAGRHIHIITGGVTVTLPATPAIGDVVGVSVDAFSTNIIDTNGQAINGTIENIEIDLQDLSLTFQFVGGAIGWEVRSQALSSSVTGGLPAQGTAPGNTLVWDDVSQNWVETDFLNVGTDTVVSGLINGEVPDQKFTRFTVIAALPGTPNENTVYLVPGEGVFLGDVAIARAGDGLVGTEAQTLRWESDNSAWEPTSTILMDDIGNVQMGNLPTADPLQTGLLWNNAGVLNISA